MSEILLFCVFSYNRGRFLENCISSIERCVPGADIAIFDDKSDDGYTEQVLDEIAQRHEVMRLGNDSSHKLGGLYGNMQYALEYAHQRRLVCFLQDDMQVVRPLADEEVVRLDQCFEANPGLAFLHPCFLKGINRERDQASLHYEHALEAYRRDQTEQSAGQYFSAIFVASPRRLLNAGWQFGRSEPVNDLQAREHFDRIGHLYAPFAMWLPDVPAYRGKRKTLALRLAEKRLGCGLYPYRLLDAGSVDQLKSRPVDILPFAEDFLTCEGKSLRKPWVYYPMQGSGWLKKLNSLELMVKNVVSYFSPRKA
jgi:glycosyltransferase involved in cell wall biosynthesis